MFPNQNPQSIYGLTDETVDLMRVALADTARSGITTGSGLQGYQLEAPAKVIVPIITPLINMIPRKKGTGNPICHWIAITSFDTARSVGTVVEGNLPSMVAYQTAAMQNPYKTLGLMNQVSFDAQWTGRSLEGDLRAKRVGELLYQLKTREELWLINASQNLMTPAAPLVTQTASTGGHASDATTYYVAVTATNTQGETLGSTVTSYTTPANSGANTGNLAITIFTVPFASNYNVYIGTTNAPASLYKQTSISGSNAAQPGYNALVSLSGGGSTPSGEIQGPTLTVTWTAAIQSVTALSTVTSNTAKTYVDGSNNTLMWDGILAQALNNSTTNNGLTLGAQITQPAATNGVMALSDIQNLLMSIYNQSAGDPDFLVMHPITANKLTNLTVAAGQTRYVIEANQPQVQGKLVSQYRVTHFLNQATGKEMPVIIDRYCPVDTILALPMSIPYPVNDIANAIEIETNQEYWGIDYAITDSSYKFADYVNEAVKVYFLGGVGILRGITPAV